ncbi:MAG: glycosyltransferase 87 family protein [Thermoanaerobaculia bacterium]|nr:glycosyltransferase 87 family protein [Thermoanaerobaculia bacterium]
MTEAEPRKSPGWPGLLPFWLLAVLSVLFVLPSARLWFQRPLRVTAYEFEYFLGLFLPPDEDLRLAVILTGRMIHFLGFLVIGLLYAVCAEKVRKGPEMYSWRFLVGVSAVLCVAFTIAMPWVSPDIFFYIGTGWLDGYYGMSPYLHTMSEVPGFRSEEMFQNVYPGFLFGPTGYGPLFQLIAKGIALVSGGREIVALALHKVLYLLVHTAGSILLARFVPASSAKWAFFFFACNPLNLFSILACVHNDHLMNLFVIAAFILLAAGRPFLTGAALGTAFSVKFVPVLLLPLFFLDLVVDSRRRRTIAGRLGLAFAMLGGFAVAAVVFHAFYPEAARQFLRIVGLDQWLQGAGSIGSGGGINNYRNSIYYLVPFIRGVFPSFRYIRYENMTLLLLLVYGAAMVWLLVRTWKPGRFPLREASLAFFLLYFLILNQTNQEWYLTWILPFLILTGTEPAIRFGYRISILFLPLVIFTVKNTPAVEYLVNALGYLVLLGFSILLFPALVKPARWHSDRQDTA